MMTFERIKLKICKDMDTCSQSETEKGLKDDLHTCEVTKQIRFTLGPDCEH